MAKKRSYPKSLPKEFKKYFWDVDFKKLAANKYPDFVLERILRYGDMRAISWMFKNTDENKVKDFIITRGERHLDKRSENFWRIIFDLPEQKRPVNAMWNF